MIKLILLMLACFLSNVKSQQGDRFLICKSVDSLFDLALESAMDNVPSGIPHQGHEPTSSFQRLQQQLKEIKGVMTRRCFTT